VGGCSCGVRGVFGLEQKMLEPAPNKDRILKKEFDKEQQSIGTSTT